MAKKTNYQPETDWDADRWHWLKDKIKIRDIMIGVLSVVAIAEAAGIASILPLKEFIPIIQVVDKSTGIVEVYKKPEIGEISERENVTKYFLKKYTKLREEYKYEVASENFDKTNLFNDVNQKKVYSDFALTTNKNAPVNVYGKDAKVEIQYKNCVPLTGYAHVWQCRFLRQVTWFNGYPTETSHWAATISFKWAGAPALEKELEINPFGMSVYDYHLDREDVVKAVMPEVKP